MVSHVKSPRLQYRRLKASRSLEQTDGAISARRQAKGSDALGTSERHTGHQAYAEAFGDHRFDRADLLHTQMRGKLQPRIREQCANMRLAAASREQKPPPGQNVKRQFVLAGKVPRCYQRHPFVASDLLGLQTRNRQCRESYLHHAIRYPFGDLIVGSLEQRDFNTGVSSIELPDQAWQECAAYARYCRDPQRAVLETGKSRYFFADRLERGKDLPNVRKNPPSRFRQG